MVRFSIRNVLAVLGIVLVTCSIQQNPAHADADQPINQEQIRFQVDRSPYGFPNLNVLRASKMSVKKSSGQFYWGSKNGSGIWVMVDLKQGIIYGQQTLSADNYAFHRIGTIDSSGDYQFLPGALFTYTSESFELPDVVSVELPIETEIIFTKSVK